MNQTRKKDSLEFQISLSPPEMKPKKGKKERPGEKLSPDLQKIEVNRGLPLRIMTSFIKVIA